MIKFCDALNIVPAVNVYNWEVYILSSYDKLDVFDCRPYVCLSHYRYIQNIYNKLCQQSSNNTNIQVLPGMFRYTSEDDKSKLKSIMHKIYDSFKDFDYTPYVKGGLYNEEKSLF